ncbi:hypothetical protein [Ralstonia phage phiRSL1]|uniref:Uncharacterized protein n=1 Tax=Ralstonia phage phiRSL1 TaxID=1980924 RepID=B2ZY72_9CAUD|nr:hypothetical protein RSL1_ORF259 [Ralstonia phage phiRSL1]BAG41707.1 hypothetical protein [Ralstonia phage phiRSL1]
MSGMVLSSLSERAVDIANRTMSAWAFYYLVGDALINNRSLSVARMGDGERQLMESCADASKRWRAADSMVSDYDEAWRKRMGIEGITYGELHRRLLSAGNDSDYFAPNISGITQPYYSVHDLFRPREQYVDNFFVNVWTQQAQAELYKTAGSLIFLHASRGLADALQIRCRDVLGVRVHYFELNNWRQLDEAVEHIIGLDAPLVLYSGGPALKCLGADVTRYSNKVVLDIGNAADYWSLLNYHP